MTNPVSDAPPLLVTAEFVFTEQGEVELLRHRDRTLDETRAVEGCFGEYRLETDHKRARKCAGCGRWTQDQPGWDESRPNVCGKCGNAIEAPVDTRAPVAEPVS